MPLSSHLDPQLWTIPAQSPRRPPSIFPTPGARAIDALVDRQCRWPIGAIDDDDFTFCTSSKRFDGAYCDAHARLARTGAAR